jgi:phosphoribosylamine---glycine ligase
MKVLVVGGGGREHALCWKLRQSPELTELFCAPGNAGIAEVADCVSISASNIVELADFAAEVRIDLTIVGPELPLSLGIADEFAKRELGVFGPSRRAAEVETSKAFAKDFCRRRSIPTAEAAICSSRGEAERAIKRFGFPAVVKADGLAAGKGVIIANDRKEAARILDLFFEERVFGAAGERVLVEEFLTGEEASFLAICDGRAVVPLATARDYKKVFDGDRGPNTGGMGSLSPAPMESETAGRALREIVVPTVAGLAEEGREFRGVLYAGLMLTQSGPKLLEFNARFGDPETEVILPRLEGDLLPALERAARGALSDTALAWKPEVCVGVVLASGGYPGAYETGRPISGLAEAGARPGVAVFHAGTARRDGDIVTSGGRVLVVTARSATLSGAVESAYDAADRISFEGKQFRRDIGGGRSSRS